MNSTHFSAIYLILSISMVQACAVKKQFIWVESLQKKNIEAAPYRIQPGDKIHIAVWNQTQISKDTAVREDGAVTVTLVGDISVAGLTTAEAAGRIAEKLESGIVQDPRVTVEVLATLPVYISVIGEVRSPGQFELKANDTLIDILSRSGGLTEFADQNSIYVLRKNSPTPKLIRFNYQRLTRTKSGGADFQLESGDAIIVEQ